MEKLIMVALKFKANLRSSMSGLLTSSVEWCGLMATEESLRRREGKGRSDCMKNYSSQKMKITFGNRYLYSPIPSILYWLQT